VTLQDHWDAEEAGDTRSDQSDAPCPSTSHRSPVHHQYGDDVGRNLERSREEGVEIDVAVKCAGVERQSVVDETTCRPTRQRAMPSGHWLRR